MKNIDGYLSKRTFIIAEISANHNQDFDTAIKLIRKAKECGADAVKFQAYTPETMTLDVNNKYFRIKHPKWGGQTLFELYKKAYTPFEWFKKLKKIADDMGIIFFATAFDPSSVDMLEDIGVPIHKIASFELVDLGLIEHAARTGKPIIISTGMATRAEINDAVSVARSSGAGGVALLKCVSSYPARAEEMNLRTIPFMEKIFKCPIGFSDHSLGSDVSIVAVSIGARLIEKHFTLSRAVKSPDSFFSMEPDEFKSLVESIRIAEKALGKVNFGLTDDEKRSHIFRRSIFAVEDIGKGCEFTSTNIRIIRPAYGLKPKYIKSVLGRRAKKHIARGTPITKEHIN